MCLAAVCVGISVGAVSIPLQAIGDILWSWTGDPARRAAWPEEYATILLHVRLPRVAMGLLAGAALAVAGTLFQTLLRNPLGDPFLLGVSAGAGLGATIALAMGAALTWWGASAVAASALAAGLLTMGLVYGLARVGRAVPISTLILSGVVVSSVLSAVTLLVAALSQYRFGEIMMWLMGRLEVSDPRLMGMAGALIVGAIAVSWACARELNAWRFGEEAAGHLGVPVETMKLVMMGLASVMTAAAVSATGLIGFVGLMVPHVMRMVVGSDHRVLIPASALGGAALLVLADVAARTWVAPVELPVGVVTALLGGPFFLFLLRKERRTMTW